MASDKFRTTTPSIIVTTYDIPDYNRIMLISLIPFILISNGFILAAFLINKRLQKVLTNYFVFSYACCDFLVGTLLIPIFLFGTPNIAGAIVMYSIMVSLFTLLFCSCDRYLAVTRPFVYEEIVTKLRVIVILLFTWLFPILIAALPSAWLKNPSDRYSKAHRMYLGIIAFSVILIAAMSMIAYGVIFRIGRKHFTAIRKAEPITEVHYIRKRVIREVKFAKLYAFLSVSFFGFWLPTGYINIVDDVFMQPNLLPPSWFVISSSYWLLLSSVINPFIYGFCQRGFRNTVLRWFKWLPCCSDENKIWPDLIQASYEDLI